MGLSPSVGQMHSSTIRLEIRLLARQKSSPTWSSSLSPCTVPLAQRWLFSPVVLPHCPSSCCTARLVTPCASGAEPQQGKANLSHFAGLAASLLTALSLSLELIDWTIKEAKFPSLFSPCVSIHSGRQFEDLELNTSSVQSYTNKLI